VEPLGPNRYAQAWFAGPDPVLIAYGSGELYEWNTNPQAWEQYACSVAGRNLTTAEWAGLFPDRSYRATCPAYPAGT